VRRPSSSWATSTPESLVEPEPTPEPTPEPEPTPPTSDESWQAEGIGTTTESVGNEPPAEEPPTEEPASAPPPIPDDAPLPASSGE